MNKKGKIIFTLASFFCLIVLTVPAFAETYSQEFPPSMIGYRARNWDTFEASWLIGYQVLTPAGGYLGQISSLVIDNTNGRVALVVLSNVPRIGNEELAIPFSSLMRTGDATFTFNPGDMPIYVGNAGVGPGSDPFIYALTWAPGTSDLYGLPAKIDTAWVSYLYRHYGQEPYWTLPGEQAPRDFELYDSHRIMGARVDFSAGGEVARVNDLVIDSSDGHIAFVVLSDFPARGDTLVAVPFGAFSRTGEELFAINISADRLASAPSFNEFADLDNMRYAESVYIYFGLQPYWTERTASPAMTEPMTEHYKEPMTEEHSEPSSAY